MRIDPRLAAAQPAPPLAKPREAGAQRFSMDTPGAKRSSGAHSSAPLATLDAILALQSEEDPAERRRRSAHRGKDLLDALDGLKAGLLSGTVSATELGRIGRGLLTGAGPSGDPALDGLVAEIELRAKVELAKLGRADLF